MNKMDLFDGIRDFARTYGALCWNLSRSLQTKDLPHIYTTIIPELVRDDCLLPLDGFAAALLELEQYINLGLYIGITGILTLKKRGADLRKLVLIIPVEQILIETDAPYLIPAPEKNRTRRNEPAFVRQILFKLAEIRKEDPVYLASATWGNSCRLFNIPF